MSVLVCRVVVLLVVAGTSALAACGGSDPEQALQESPPDNRLALIGEREIGKLRGDSVERAFFEYWSNLQFQAWPAATSYLAPGFKRAAGGERNVIAALSSESSFFRSARLRLVSSNERRGLTTLRYMVTDDATGRLPRSTTWRRTPGGGWEIVYDGLLTEVLAGYAITTAQERIDPTAEAPSAVAQKAGRRVAERQAAYLERLLSARGR